MSHNDVQVSHNKESRDKIWCIVGWKIMNVIFLVWDEYWMDLSKWYYSYRESRIDDSNWVIMRYWDISYPNMFHSFVINRIQSKIVIIIYRRGHNEESWDKIHTIWCTGDYERDISCLGLSNQNMDRKFPRNDQKWWK